MNIEEQIKVLEQKVKALIEAEPDIFLVEIRIKPTNHVKVFLDTDKGISLGRLTGYTRKLHKELEENNFFAGGDFALELSSPGLDEPLKLHRQYLKNIGRSVEVTRVDGVKKEGKLVQVGQTDIVVEEEKASPAAKPGQGSGKNKEGMQHTIAFSEIKTTKIQIKF